MFHFDFQDNKISVVCGGADKCERQWFGERKYEVKYGAKNVGFFTREKIRQCLAGRVDEKVLTETFPTKNKDSWFKFGKTFSEDVCHRLKDFFQESYDQSDQTHNREIAMCLDGHRLLADMLKLFQQKDRPTNEQVERAFKGEVEILEFIKPTRTKHNGTGMAVLDPFLQENNYSSPTVLDAILSTLEKKIGQACKDTAECQKMIAEVKKARSSVWSRHSENEKLKNNRPDWMNMKELDGFEQPHFMGNGSEGSVYSFYHDGERVAVKWGYAGFYGTMDELHERFSAGKNMLPHDSIMKNREFLRHGSQFIEVMDFTEGVAFQHIDFAKVNLEMKKQIMSQLTAALDHLHKQRLSHNDISSTNVMIQYDHDNQNLKAVFIDVAYIYDGDFKKDVKHLGVLFRSMFSKDQYEEYERLGDEEPMLKKGIERMIKEVKLFEEEQQKPSNWMLQEEQKRLKSEISAQFVYYPDEEIQLKTQTQLDLVTKYLEKKDIELPEVEVCGSGGYTIAYRNKKTNNVFKINHLTDYDMDMLVEGPQLVQEERENHAGLLRSLKQEDKHYLPSAPELQTFNSDKHGEFIVSESSYAGISVKKFLTLGKPISPKFVATLMEHLSQSLLAVCRAGWRHQDLNAGNICINEKYDPADSSSPLSLKLIDFGMSEKNTDGSCDHLPTAGDLRMGEKFLSFTDNEERKQFNEKQKEIRQKYKEDVAKIPINKIDLMNEAQIKKIALLSKLEELFKGSGHAERVLQVLTDQSIVSLDDLNKTLNNELNSSLVPKSQEYKDWKNKYQGLAEACNKLDGDDSGITFGPLTDFINGW